MVKYWIMNLKWNLYDNLGHWNFTLRGAVVHVHTRQCMWITIAKLESKILFGNTN